MLLKRRIDPSDRVLIDELLQSLPAFTDAERAVALELCDAGLASPGSDDYRFILAPTDRGLAGYLCYGRTPMTQSTFDLYWIATSPALARSGVARQLVAAMEGDIAGRADCLVRAETGSREAHGTAVHFYEAIGFSRSATVADYYAPGDDLIIFTRRIKGRARSDNSYDPPERARET